MCLIYWRFLSVGFPPRQSPERNQTCLMQKTKKYFESQFNNTKLVEGTGRATFFSLKILLFLNLYWVRPTYKWKAII